LLPEIVGVLRAVIGQRTTPVARRGGQAGADLDATIAALKARGWRSEGEAFEIPDGPCYRVADPGGNPYALFQNDRPEAMEPAYADRDNANAIRG
jgi:hypothetical protein